jgi:wobble nucleotide-excising tRNase
MLIASGEVNMAIATQIFIIQNRRLSAGGRMSEQSKPCPFCGINSWVMRWNTAK